MILISYYHIDKGGRLKTELYDKHDDFTFSIVNLPIISINIPALLHYQSIYVTNDHGYVPDPGLIHDLSPGLVTRVTHTAPLVE